jgi:UDP-3-O-acyl N-acetylglucosamine deacetylase
VVFVRTDLPGRPSVEATLANVPSAQRWTSLKKGAAEVRMIEHVMATLVGIGLDNVIIECSAPEMPVGDGSSMTFVTPLLDAGLVKQDAPRRILRIGEPIAVAENDVLITAMPLADSLVITYVLDYGNRFIRSQALTMTIDRETFVHEIAPARTYVLRPEVDAFIKNGLGKGATPENTVVLEEDGTLSVPERLPNECVRHKILDMMGDLYLTGAALQGRLLGYKSGHNTNVRLARAMDEAAGRG